MPARRILVPSSSCSPRPLTCCSPISYSNPGPQVCFQHLSWHTFFRLSVSFTFSSDRSKRSESHRLLTLHAFWRASVRSHHDTHRTTFAIVRPTTTTNSQPPRSEQSHRLVPWPPTHSLFADCHSLIFSAQDASVSRYLDHIFIWTAISFTVAPPTNRRISRHSLLNTCISELQNLNRSSHAPRSPHFSGPKPLIHLINFTLRQTIFHGVLQWSETTCKTRE